MSPDGQWLAIGTGAPGEEGTLRIVPAAGGEARVLRRRQGFFRKPQWTPDGRYLMYLAGTQLYRLPAEGGEPQPVGVQAQNSNQSIFAIHPDGRKLAFLGGNPKGAIWVMERFLPKPESAP